MIPEIADACRDGKIGCMECKAKVAKRIAEQTMQEVREAMGIHYFS
ncbi:hypothetical protein LSG31_19640 [Fodinisporobacter ferrooxydans]|uniref:Tryptophan--tRNA ligase n=1 Tax=Fodinisporobacter ferrooxydans TaxID=2901836 RepID=A0ABY4CKT8_9BACL|nr:hypothetical protein LSG31_19640 [Alicyclobacillaceae bacterium MYW30-H2]